MSVIGLLCSMSMPLTCSDCLAADLAHQGYYEDERFMRYLKYLTYWQQPAYARYLRYPICLDFLELLLEKESFRMAVKGDQYARMTEEQVLLQWTFRAKNDATYAPEPATVAVTATP